MADRSNYSDKNADTFALPEHKIFSAGVRTYTPSDNESSGGFHSSLAEESMNGDWSWKPQRDKRLKSGYDKDRAYFDDFKTFRGVPPSAAELYGPRILS